MTQPLLTPHQSQYYAWLLSRRTASDSVEALASTLVDSQVDLNPHQIEAALFACKNPLSRGVILADEVGLGKTIEAGLVITQRWAERRRRILIIVPAHLRKQWQQELQDKFGLPGLILDAGSYQARRRQARQNPFLMASGPVICSYQFAKAKAGDLQDIAWDLVVMDEAHRLRNVYKTGNVIARTLQQALAHAHCKVLLTATPLQNSLLELYGLVSVIDERVFGDIDSFRSRFTAPAKEQAFAALRTRLAPVCKRTLRRQVQQYVSYTARRAIVQEFTPSAEEQELSGLVADYLRRPKLKALPDGQRQLISLVLWKLLASSTHAIAGTLETMAKRLQGLLDDAPDVSDKALDDDYEPLAATADEWSAHDDSAAASAGHERDAIADEIAELRRFKALASSIRDNAKGRALLTALERAFAELERLGAAKKAIIFTESRRTQQYLLSLLADTRYGAGIVLFNGTNSDARAQAIYRDWRQRHGGSSTDSPTADTRAALVEHFKERGTVMIATEAGAEGINLQFCSLVINYDLPWNPQRIEQRIGRCHRYGQQHDVVVVNFVDRSNEADARVYQLLAEKFHLFEGVFGASDEVLGTIGSGVDFERRIADIYQNCRDTNAIKASFEQLQLDLSGEINAAMLKTRQVLLENFDEEVQDKLRTHAQDSRSARSKYERMLMELTRVELRDYASFDEEGFDLQRAPADIPLGRYELPRHAGDAHLYRIGHPLAAWVIDQAKSRALANTRLIFDYDAHGTPISTLKTWRGKTGWLTVQLITVQALETREQHLIVAASTTDGEILAADDPEKLLRLPVRMQTPCNTANANLADNVQARKTALLNQIEQRNLGHFDQEVQKLDAWADDLKLGLEQEIKEIDRQIKEVRRTAATAPTLEDKLAQQKHQRELETKRTTLRRELFTRQDEIEAQRGELINQLEVQVRQRVEEQTLFTIEWELK
ncbi:DEAD/DEAH box helicase [Verminephrobacter eiseniae]|uniref:DEAD/DEAH box helicase n=1 Tax=Verminephrobacter eiseniae TaxID=364317 RepID=UPI002237B454|nr:DEAD/DEAH box helicase [Verminephrobacter eiseniae]MCW5234475.1 DEAD/DEAH box helicase [Verminephrobacter eiseniae]MCW5293948.1 DEAD/DEAH box helicase [Verminephrobacter eiseniae]MCW8186043.1 DEAD/DEAH box helicase [Verminephrobacter eiseniae]MCW8222240.1 DEAD/DEAH box helicase [Verminephrobacter eiseniae]MCW8235276.1 DEAD/DEAH box helicase [Verminephrobacter eiseniae]